MELVQSAAQRQVRVMGAEMRSSLAILSMPAVDLAEHIASLAEANPAIRYTPPVPRGRVADFDAAAALAADRPSLIGHVLTQIDMAFADPADHRAALVFAQGLEPTGWLGPPLPRIAAEAGLTLPQAEALLARLQGLEPTGLFARSLEECLALQAREAGALTWEMETLLAHLPLLAEGRLRELADLCDCEPADIPLIARQLRAYDPKPGLAYAFDPEPIFPPDLVAARDGNGWQVTLHRSAAFAIQVLPDRLPEGPRDPAAAAFRRKALAEARALAQALERRNATLLRTAAVLVARQAEFLDQGPGCLAPLTLDDIAAELELHPSTISRATAGRMIDTPRGALPLRAFFSRALTGGEEGVSQDRARAFVRRVIAEEDPDAPLSDDAIVTLARKADLTLARRTVAKYRLVLGIAGSFQRRRKTLETAG
ncbi:RNA polymerase factor sigma-54 [Rhodobacter sp. Har01]|uniref:RNA polymerase factor sigma-54 n=1 Tax=Rhodobacter sp. Har01 TaxID=2883999 RepID=UPI001D069DDA|nr:RNA polymerase factor sigma-54 [Rhodobacter sp. Har01]MCB6178314.1 RNA polymerase factor sigma-54 [Rhodobacter sp. Har01]